MVKNNFALSSITSQSLLLKHLLTQQLDCIQQTAATVHSLVDQHFKELSSVLEKAYSDFMVQKSADPHSATLFQFQPNQQLVPDLKALLGDLQEIKFSFG